MTRCLLFFCVLFIRPSSLIVADSSCTISSPLKSDCEGIRFCGPVKFNDDNPINCPRKMYNMRTSSSSREEIKDLQCDKSSGNWKSIQILNGQNISGHIIAKGSTVYCQYDECDGSKLFPPCGTDIECKEHSISSNKLKYSCPRHSALWTRRSESESWVKLEDAKHLTCGMEKFWANDEAPLPAGTQASCREPYVVDEGSNVGLYIGLGIIGFIVIVAIFICVFMRKTGMKWHHFGFHDTPAAKKEYNSNTPTINSPVGNSPKVKSPDVGSPHVETTPSNQNKSAEAETGTPRKAPSTEKGGVTTSADKITNEDLMSKEKINENQVFNI